MNEMKGSRDFSIRQRGKIGEEYVCEYLRAHGCTVIAANYHSRWGEIDVIAENEVRILFVEVKTRTQRSLTGGLESVTPSKIKKITKTAAHYLAENPTDKQPRIDCAQVIVDEQNNVVHIDYIKNAVEQTGEYSAY